MPVTRTPWGDFPPITAQTTVSKLKSDPDYLEAKHGNLRAARRLIARLFKPAKFEPPFPVNFIVPVTQLDLADQWNAIPMAYAERLALSLGAKLAPTIVQNNAVHHTEATAAERLVHQPSFIGRVTPGAYVIVDDVATLGSTLANLRGHIEANGGRVAAATTLANAIFSAKLAPDPAVIAAVKRRFKSELPFLQDRLGFPADCLTGRESYYVNRLQNLESVRNPLAETHRSIRPPV